MSKLVSLALLALAAVSAVSGSPIAARATPPPGWIAEILESYDDYHTRYIAVGCQGKHNTEFFDDCCHPMKKGETLEKNRKAYCRPGASPAPSSTPAAQPPAPSPSSQRTPVSGDDDDCDDDGDDDVDDNDDDDGDDEDCEDDPVPSSVPSYSPAPVPTSTPKPEPTPSPNPPKPTSTSSTSKPSPTPANNPSSETHTGGHVTWYTQNGNYGACGNKHSDDDFIAALDYRAYGDLGAKSKYCGQKIRVSWKGKSVDVIVEDACPTCVNSASVDLSTAAFKALAPLSVGELDGVTWQLL